MISRMSKKYTIKPPQSNYIQIMAFAIILIAQLQLKIRFDDELHILRWFTILLALIVIVIQVYRMIRFEKEIEITTDSIKLKNLEFPINDIEKIIIQGYFIQSIGIKRVGQRFVSARLHFRFKNDEEKQVEEWEKWAQNYGIPVIKGKIYKWL